MPAHELRRATMEACDVAQRSSQKIIAAFDGEEQTPGTIGEQFRRRVLATAVDTAERARVGSENARFMAFFNDSKLSVRMKRKTLNIVMIRLPHINANQLIFRTWFGKPDTKRSTNEKIHGIPFTRENGTTVTLVTSGTPATKIELALPVHPGEDGTDVLDVEGEVTARIL